MSLSQADRGSFRLGSMHESPTCRFEHRIVSDAQKEECVRIWAVCHFDRVECSPDPLAVIGWPARRVLPWHGRFELETRKSIAAMIGERALIVGVGQERA